MPKYYCDYCDIFLTHDSLAVRKAHNSGWKHAAAVREYYAALGQDTTQSVIDQITQAYNSTGGFPPMARPPMMMGMPPNFAPMMPPPHMFNRPPGPPPPGFVPNGQNFQPPPPPSSGPPTSQQQPPPIHPSRLAMNSGNL
ncbi:U1 small nuclear ribonucleoprotein C [Entomophthora muscae]|uniref:U1 small nuclear ribonucleoprotein C n=3 Tax=Entomophthora muscae TaxID=34485 RepID=A0ACC2RXE8_9FUNG|nr:U1 small nuclear ribonucleoprotein C [Entomophthora muscae]KAJ9057142.1 U1 small nuclear ribonucleoprotein C [Entomophthora muscae]KAJ9067497.1 U1 small nuclear ribonucleoprotein C [Entomophthora muscae]